MFPIDEELIKRRNLTLQHVIDLTQANGPEYLAQLEKFNARFSFNPNNQILTEKQYTDEQQTVPV